MEAITFESGINNVTMNVEQVKRMYEDISFLEDAILSILDKSEKNDIPLKRADYIKYLNEYFMKNGNWSEDFIKQVFKQVV